MKRMGRGTIYYGDRPDYDLDEADAQQLDTDLLKEDAVLVTGATGRAGQWITLGLLNISFNVRCLTRKFQRAEDIFGPTGANVDVLEADVREQPRVNEAVEDAVAIICVSGGSRWMPGSIQAVEVDGVRTLLDAALQPDSRVDLFVLISTVEASGARGRAKRVAEEMVRQSGLPFVIFRVNDLDDCVGGSKEIVMKPVLDDDVRVDGGIACMDLAQCVCQALVHRRKIAELKDLDGGNEFQFPNGVVAVGNSDRELVPDKRFWSPSFKRIGDEFRTED